MPQVMVHSGFSASRAGYRSAQDLICIPSLQAPCALRGADGRTVGGSADDHILFFLLQRTMEQNVDIPVLGPRRTTLHGAR